MMKRLPGIALALLQLTIIPSAGDRMGQLCWALDRQNNTVYLADVEGRRDPGAVLSARLGHSGLDHLVMSCVVQPMARRRAIQANLKAKWLQAKFEIVDLTLMAEFTR